MQEPIVREPVFAPEVHGDTGIGNCILPRSPRTVVKEPAVLYLNKLLSDLPEKEQVTIVATGPLTNIGLLLKLFPGVKGKIREIIFMGGSACGGNVTPSAEFNMYVDPEAARIVLRSSIPLVMCGLDVTMDCGLTRGQILKLCQSPNKVAKACGDMAGYTLENCQEKYRGMISIHDVVPFMYLLHPEIFKAEKVILDADCSEGASRGTTLCDLRWWQHDTENLKDWILLKADGKAFHEYLITSLFKLGEMLEKTKGN
jgi:pyrimidine-specific ribonucleoside hydrolase/ribosylpyrimidine nucleosidase